MVTRTRFRGADNANGPSARNGAGSRTPPADAPWAALQKAWRAFGKRVPELRDDLSCYAAAQVDRARLSVSQAVSRVLSGILLVIAVAAIFTIAAALTIAGIAGGVAAALAGNVWLANVITGT